MVNLASRTERGTYEKDDGCRETAIYFQNFSKQKIIKSKMTRKQMPQKGFVDQERRRKLEIQMKISPWAISLRRGIFGQLWRLEQFGHGTSNAVMN